MAQGDNCLTALPVVPGTHFADGPATGAGSNSLCFGSLATNADWYVYTPAANGTIDVQSCFYGADTRLSVFGGTCAALTCLGSADDSCPMTLGGAGFASNVIGLPVLAGQNYYIQWDDYWTTQSFNWDLLFHCAAAPQATQGIVPDCVNGVFYIDINITAMGSAVTVDITNDGGAPTLSGVGLGSHTIGPFLLGTVVQYVLVNNDDPGCDFFSVDVTNLPCPFISCGPDNYTYCYTNNENVYFVYQSASTFPIALIFNAGAMYQFDGDQITIYDGLDIFAPVLFTGDNGGLSFGGMLFVSTNVNNALTFQITSDAFTSCFDFGLTPFDWTVSCLDCTNPTGVFAVEPDCIHRQFSILLDLTGTGTATSADVVNSYNTDTVQNISVGLHTIGPFPMDTLVQLTVLNNDNPLCRIYSPDFTYASDDCVIVSCGVDNYNYCYLNNDAAWFVYQAAGPFPITISFIQGEMLVDDKIIVYNGDDDFSALIYQGNAGGNLAGLELNSGNPDNIIALRILSNGTGSCADGGADAEMQWWVGCGLVGLDEQAPGAFALYPNPTDGMLNLELGETWSGPISVQVTDLAGRIVIGQQLNAIAGSTSKIDMSRVQDGNYIVQLITDKWVKAQQVVVTR